MHIQLVLRDGHLHGQNIIINCTLRCDFSYELRLVEDVSHLQVCTMLNSYLLRQYPAESAARAAEIKETVRISRDGHAATPHLAGRLSHYCLSPG